MKDHSTL